MGALFGDRRITVMRFKFTSRKKLKARIVLLERENKRLTVNIGHLCDNYNSDLSMGIRVTYKIFKMIDEQIMEGDAGNPQTKGIFNQ